MLLDGINYEREAWLIQFLRKRLTRIKKRRNKFSIDAYLIPVLDKGND